MVTFRKHDVVLLSVGDTIVGSGTLQKVFPNDILHGMTLGDDRLAVYVDDAFDWEVNIPYPTEHVKKLGQARDIVILWDSGDVDHLPKPPMENSNKHDGEDARLRIADSQGTHGEDEAAIVTPDCEGTHGQDDAHVTILDSQEDTSVHVASSSFAMDIAIEEVPFEHELDEASKPIGLLSESHLPSTFSLRPTVGGVDGDEVDLFIDGCKVGRAIVHHVDATMKCHNVLIGKDNISVMIVEVEEEHETDSLPFPHADADTLEDTIGVPCKWAKLGIQKFGSTWESSGAIDEEFDNINVDETTQGKEHIFDKGVD